MLLLNQFFHPSSAATSQLLTDLARHLADQGHPVTAICGRSDYSHASGGHVPGVTVLRTPNLPFGCGKAVRLLSYASFYAGAIYFALTRQKPKTVLTLTTPPLLPLVGTFVKKLRGARHVIWEMDVYPDVAVQLGVLSPRSSLARITRVIADWSRRNADTIIALGEEMKSLLTGRGIPAEKIEVAENWADSTEIEPLPFPDGPLHVLYSGNLGLAHDLDTIQASITRLPGCVFTFAGAGPRRQALETFCHRHNLTNVFFRGYCDRAALGKCLSEGHIGLVTLNSAVAGSVVPSKIYGIMAAGRPVLYIGPADTTADRIIRRFDCGWHVRPGDVDGLVALFENLNVHRNLLYTAGERARQVFLENYDRSIGVCRIAAILARLSPSASTVPVASPGESATLYPVPDTSSVAARFALPGSSQSKPDGEGCAFGHPGPDVHSEVPPYKRN